MARLNGRTVQVINLQINTDWSDYCHYYSQYASSLRKMLSVTCRTLGYEDLHTYSSKENQLMNVDINKMALLLFNQTCNSVKNAIYQQKLEVTLELTVIFHGNLVSISL